MAQFKPHAIGRENAKALLINDQEFTTPQDHYFSYINKRQGQSSDQVKENDLSIMKGLGLDMYLPPTFNVETGKFDDPKLLDETGLELNEDEMDIFDLARRRGSKINDLKVMAGATPDTIELAKLRQSQLSGQKHAKKDYERLKSMTINEVVLMTREDRRKQEFQDESLKGIVKIEKKRAFKKKSRKE